MEMITGSWVIVVGAVLALIGFGRLGLSTNADENAAFNEQWGIVCRVAGFAVAFVGVAILLIKFQFAGLAVVVALCGVAALAVKLLARGEGDDPGQ